MRAAKLKSVALPTSADLGEASLTYALEILQAEEWADLVVHQADVRHAMKVARIHNDKKPKVCVRVLTDTTLGRADWRLRSTKAEVRSS